MTPVNNAEDLQSIPAALLRSGEFASAPHAPHCTPAYIHGLPAVVAGCSGGLRQAR